MRHELPDARAEIFVSPSVKIAPQFIFNNSLSAGYGSIVGDRINGRRIRFDRAGREVLGAWVETSELDGTVNAGAVARSGWTLARAGGPVWAPTSNK